MPIIDLTSKKFGDFEVISYHSRDKYNNALWLCRCVKCNKEKILMGSRVSNGRHDTCYCGSHHNATHAESNSKEYRAYKHMLSRCQNPNVKEYPRYGGRGIKVCDRWIESYENFIADMGHAPSLKHSLDRIKVNGDYKKSNCRWATLIQQANNTRRTFMVHFNGQKIPLGLFCKEYQLPIEMIRGRLNLGWTVERAMSTPKLSRNRNGNTDKTMKYTLLLIALLISSLCFSQTDFLIRVRDPVFKSVVITQEKTIPNIKVKPGETIDYHLPSGQNIGFAALTIDAPLDTTKKWIFKISAVEDTATPTELVLKETLNDNSARVIYTGTWVKYTNQAWTAPFLNNDVSVTTTVNSAAAVTFTGKKVSVTAELRENHGVAKIEVKQGTTVIDSKTVDMYKATTVNAPAVIYESGVLPQGTYTVTVSLNSITTGRDSMVLDSFFVME